MSNYNTRWAMIIATVAIGIKLSKDWYLQQAENLEILRQKTKSVTELQKARLHPELLFRSLSTIYTNIQRDSDKATSIILNLSDLLSYSLYESDVKWISLQKELSELHNLISLEQQQSKDDPRIEIKIQIDGEINDKLVAPMTIVKLLDDFINLLRNMETGFCRIDLHFTVINKDLLLNISFIGLNEKAATMSKWLLLIENVQNRFSEYYSEGDYKIELTVEKNKIVVKITLRMADNLDEVATKLTMAS